MSRTCTLALAALAVMAIVALAACGGEAQVTPPTGGRTPTPAASPSPRASPSPGAAASPSPGAAASPSPGAGGATIIQVELMDPANGGEYEFRPSEFTFTTGQTVEFVLRSESEFHTFTVDALDIDVSVEGGQTQRSTHTFNQAGTFELICIPHETLGMVGQITVR